MPVKAVSKIKRVPWYQKRIVELENELINLKESAKTVESIVTDERQDIHIDSYTKGFYDCMNKYGIFAKGARKRIAQTIKERYKGNGDTKYVWRVK